MADQSEDGGPKSQVVSEPRAQATWMHPVSTAGPGTVAGTVG